MRGEGHILVYCPIDTLQWGSTHSAMLVSYSPFDFVQVISRMYIKCFAKLISLTANIKCFELQSR